MHQKYIDMRSRMPDIVYRKDLHKYGFPISRAMMGNLDSQGKGVPPEHVFTYGKLKAYDADVLMQWLSDRSENKVK